MNHRSSARKLAGPPSYILLVCLSLGVYAQPMNALSAQTSEFFYGKWSNSPDSKSCNLPVGSSPNDAILYQINRQGIAFYEIACTARKVTLRTDGANYDLDCFKGEAARWFEKASLRTRNANRLTLSFADRKPPSPGAARTETLYRCPEEMLKDAPPPKASVSRWMHNGSVMTLTESQGDLEIAYIDPRAGLVAVGVRANTILFSGLTTGNRVEGKAYTFNSVCGPVGYQVNGQFLNEKNVLLLSGMTSRLNSNCEVIKRASESLRFERML